MITKKKISKLTCFIMIFTMIFTLNLDVFKVSAQAVEVPEEATIDIAPEGYVPENTPIKNSFSDRLKAANNKILLIEDVNPWGTTAHHTIMQQYGSVKKVSSTNAALEDFTEYAVVILSNDQYATTYRNLQNFNSHLEGYLDDGGVVIFGSSTGGWNETTNSSKELYQLPDGVTQTYVNSRTTNKIVNPMHQIITGALTNHIPLLNSDLTNSGGINFGVFDEDSLPASASVIIRDTSNGATLVEYPYGKGTVIVSEIGWEFDLLKNGKFAKKALKDLYSYALSRSGVGFSFDVTSAVVKPGETADIIVSMRNNPGFAGADFNLSFENLGIAGNLKPIAITPLNEFTTGIFSSNMDTANNGAALDWNTKKIITVTWSDSDNITVADSELFKITFDISAASADNIYGMDLSGSVVNQLYENVGFSARPGIIEVNSDNPNDFLYGDSHYNNLVDIKDATRFAQFLVSQVGLSSYEKRAANVHYDLDSNEEDVLDINDAIKLSQWLADYENIILGDGPAGTGSGRKPQK
jgi:hypothetical protein